MTEYTRDFFIANRELLPAEHFTEYFSPELHYVYEVFRVIDGIPLFIEDHLERFFLSSISRLISIQPLSNLNKVCP
ncbi:MAG: hypothetical protein IPH20_07485 [Bacteroidales bacterium]|nr:hypothetical protein [Bacteroidales bacterium]